LRFGHAVIPHFTEQWTIPESDLKLHSFYPMVAKLLIAVCLAGSPAERVRDEAGGRGRLLTAQHLCASRGTAKSLWVSIFPDMLGEKCHILNYSGVQRGQLYINVAQYSPYC